MQTFTAGPPTRFGLSSVRALSLVLMTLGVIAFAGCRHVGQAGAKRGARVERPEGPLDLERAQQYVLELVNHDRTQEGLGPVEWDEVAARAAARHAEDMVRHGFTGHWGSDGSVPEFRYTEAGGEHMVQENAACFFDGVEREPESRPLILASEVEKIEAAFMGEVPPNDGHRRNILKATHNRVGIGFAQPRGRREVCMVQEFIDEYGEYDPLPRSARRRSAITVAGEIDGPVEFGGVGLARTQLPRPMSFRELTAKTTYFVPEPYVLFFPAGYKTPKPVRVDGRSFSIEVALDDRGAKGLYEVSVWGKHPGGDSLAPISLRTIVVE